MTKSSMIMAGRKQRIRRHRGGNQKGVVPFNFTPVVTREQLLFVANKSSELPPSDLSLPEAGDCDCEQNVGSKRKRGDHQETPAACGAPDRPLPVTFKRSLMSAASRKDEALVRELLDLSEVPSDQEEGACGGAGPHPDTKDINYALLVAVTNHTPRIVQMLCEAGADTKHYDQWCPLLLSAIDNDCLETVKILLQHGADVHACRPDSTALHCAVKKGDLELAEQVLGMGVNIEVRNTLEGATPLHAAVHSGQLQSVLYLLDKGCDINVQDDSRGRTPLIWAVMLGRKTIVTSLISRGADVMIADKQEMLPTMLAHKLNFHDLIPIIMSAYTHIDDVDKNGRTTLHHACRAKYTEFVQTILNKGANCNSLDTNGNTPLLEACRHGSNSKNPDPVIVKTLLEQPDIQVDAVNHDNCAPMAGALAACEDFEIPELLLKGGANINLQDTRGHTLLMGNIHSATISNWLIQNGADPNIIAFNGNSLLAQAVPHGLETVKRVLFECNVDLRLSACENENGKAPVMCAIEMGQPELVKLMVHAGCSLKNVSDWLKTNEAKAYTEGNDPDGMGPVVRWLIEKVKQPLSLKQWSRQSAMKLLGHTDVKENIDRLYLPTLLKDYLKPEEYMKWAELEDELCLS